MPSAAKGSLMAGVTSRTTWRAAVTLLSVLMPVVLPEATAQQTGLTDDDCTVSTYREVPEQRPSHPLPCTAEYREWSHVAIVANNPTAEDLNQDLPSSFLRKVEVLVHTPLNPLEPTDLIQSLSGHNHYLVFSHVGHSHPDARYLHKPALTMAEIFNRLVMMANADVVVLAHREDAALVNQGMVHKAAQIFSAHPNMGILGTHIGYTMGGWIAALPKLQYVAAVEMGPIIVRRSFFLEVGMLDCLQDKCFQQAIHSLSLRMLLAGRRVGLMSFPNQDGIVVTRVQDNLQHPKPFCDGTGVTGILQKAVLKYAKLFEPREFDAKTDLNVDGISPANVPEIAMSYCEPKSCDSIRKQTAILVQYFQRPEEGKVVLAAIYSSLAKDQETNMTRVEIIVHDDSRSDYEALRHKLILFPFSWLIYAPNTHEIRAYNRMSKFTTAQLLVFAQDDDAPLKAKAKGWLSQANDLFRGHPKLGFLGAHRGRMDFGWLVDGRTNQISGPKFGTASDTARTISYRQISHFSPPTGHPFMYVYKINAGPLFASRQRFLAAGMFHTGLSCPGDPGIGFDFEFSIRTWSLDQEVGLFPANWTGHIGNSTESGTRSDQEKWRTRRRMEMRNNGLMYEMYPDIHHVEGTRMTVEALGTLTAGARAFTVHDDEHMRSTLTFLGSLRHSSYCDLLGYGDIIGEAFGACCQELKVPDPVGSRGIKHLPEDYHCVPNPRQWESQVQAMRSYLETNDLWLDEEAEWSNLHRYFNGTVLRSQPEWLRYVKKGPRGAQITEATVKRFHKVAKQRIPQVRRVYNRPVPRRPAARNANMEDVL